MYSMQFLDYRDADATKKNIDFLFEYSSISAVL